MVIRMDNSRRKNSSRIQAMICSWHCADDAVRLVSEHNFAVVLIDVQVHGFDAFDTARRIRAQEHPRRTPIIFLTEHGDHRFSAVQAYCAWRGRLRRQSD
jgi:DNA-binding response OmpR family regulator